MQFLRPQCHFLQPKMKKFLAGASFPFKNSKLAYSFQALIATFQSIKFQKILAHASLPLKRQTSMQFLGPQYHFLEHKSPKNLSLTRVFSLKSQTNMQFLRPQCHFLQPKMKKISRWREFFLSKLACSFQALIGTCYEYKISKKISRSREFPL